MSTPKGSGAGERPAEHPLACLRCRALFAAGRARCPIDGARLVAIASDPRIGTSFGAHYLIETVIGDGGLGRVYRARDQHDRCRCAILVPHGEQIADPSLRHRLAREAQRAGRGAGGAGCLREQGVSREGLPFWVVADEPPVIEALRAASEPRDLSRALAGASAARAAAAPAPRRGRRTRVLGLAALALIAGGGSAGATLSVLGGSGEAERAPAAERVAPARTAPAGVGPAPARPERAAASSRRGARPIPAADRAGGARRR